MTRASVNVRVHTVVAPLAFVVIDVVELVLTWSDLPQVLVLRLQRILFVDMTGLQILEDLMWKLKQRGIRVILCEANEQVHAKLIKTGLHGFAGRPSYAPDIGKVQALCGLAAVMVGDTAFTPQGRWSETAQRLIETSRKFFLEDGK